MNKKTLSTLLLLFISMLSQSVYGQKPLPKPIRPHKTVTKPKPSKPTYTVISSVCGSHHGHDYVDLGLPSGLKWATYNVGASSPEEYGSYYAWGETSEKSEYTQKNSVTCNKKFGDISGNSQYDAARYNWGGSWRLPTNKEQKELITHCNYKWTYYKGVKGGLFKSKKNGRVIFIPAAGYFCETLVEGAGNCGSVWSSTQCDDDDCNAYFLRIYDNDADWYGCFNLFYGRTVRSVLK